MGEVRVIYLTQILVFICSCLMLNEAFIVDIFFLDLDAFFFCVWKENKEEGKKEETKEEKKEEEKKEEKKDEEQPPEIVLKVDMHCEACARKVAKALKGFEGNN